MATSSPDNLYLYQLSPYTYMNTTNLCLPALSTAPSPTVSAKYQHITTSELLAPLFCRGWVIDDQQVTRSTQPEHAKHILRLSNPDLGTFGDYKPQVVVSNSGGGQSSFVALAGLLKFACANGITIGTGLMHIKVPHRGNDLQFRAVSAVESVVHKLPTIANTVTRWAAKPLSEVSQAEFYRRAAAIRWDISDNLTVRLDDMATVRRVEDRSTDLWTTFNRAQECLIRGGIRVSRRVYVDPRMSVQGPQFQTSTTTAKAVTSIDQNLRINTTLWSLAEEFSN